jgi:hypothetical protein
MSHKDTRLAVLLSPTLGPVLVLSMIKEGAGYSLDNVGLGHIDINLERVFSRYVFGKDGRSIANDDYIGHPVNIRHEGVDCQIQGKVYVIDPVPEFTVTLRTAQEVTVYKVEDADAILFLNVEQPNLSGHARVDVEIPSIKRLEATNLEAIKSELNKFLADIERTQKKFLSEIASANFYDMDSVEARVWDNGRETYVSASGSTLMAKPVEVRRIIAGAIAQKMLRIEKKNALEQRFADLTAERDAVQRSLEEIG